MPFTLSDDEWGITPQMRKGIKPFPEPLGAKIYQNYMNDFFKNKEKQEIPVTFYSTKGPFGCFSNFSRHPIKLAGFDYPTSEHYYQSKKFEGTQYEKQVREAKGPKAAAILGRDPSNPLREDWNQVKEDVMYEALHAKFTQHRKCREILLGTGDAKIIEASPKDSYWGWGENRLGQNRLGILLMRLREELRAKAI